MDRQRHAAEIRAVGVCKRYDAFEALSDIDLTIGGGEFVTLLGPSGSGKTTFLMLVAGFERVSAGNLFRDWVDITEEPAEKRNFGMVFQGYALFPTMTVADNIAFPLKVRRRPSAEIARRVGEMIERVGLVGHGHKRPAQLSGGQQQRVALGRALVFEPDVLLLDEPFSALDKNLREAMQAEMRRLHRDFGTTFIFVTHDQSEALALSSRIAIFERGRLLQFGAPREVYDRPADRFTAEFLGQVDLIPLDDCRVDGSLLVGLFEGVRIAAPAPDAAVGGRVTVGVRPEHVRLRNVGARTEAGENALPVRVSERAYLGGHTRLTLVSGSGVRFSADVATADPLAAAEEGTPLVFTFSPVDGRIVPDAAAQG